MPDGTLERSYGTVFNRIADSYDRHRPAYPEELIDRAFAGAGLAPGDAVLEIGCGTGLLTRSLLIRGVSVTAIEPGDRLLALAQESLVGSGDVRFLNTRLEEAQLPREHFSAVFCASAIHWIDPDVSWQRAADALVPGGTLALVQYFGLDDPACAEDQQALLKTVFAIAPELAGRWPIHRNLEATLSGVHERRGNISEVWAWLGNYEVARADAGALFDDARIDAVPVPSEHTAEELNALLATMSSWSRLSPAQREAIQRENQALHDRIGRPIRSTTLACLLTARRSPCSP